MQRLIRRHLCEDDGLCELLATFNDEPAIFYRKSPSDTDFLDGCWPQLVLSVDKFSDEVHGVAGLLTIDILSSQAVASPEVLEPLVRSNLENIFFKPELGEIFRLKWQRTDVFQEPASERLPLILGATATFEIYEFPTAETSSPDPIQTLNLWSAKTFRAVTIGETNFDDVFRPNRSMPAIYFDTERIRLLTQHATAFFLQSTIKAHVFADTVKARREWLTELNFAIVRHSTFRLEDSSPLRLTGAELDFAASEIQGQLTLTFEYGADKFHYAHPLMNKILSFKEAQHVYH